MPSSNAGTNSGGRPPASTCAWISDSMMPPKRCQERVRSPTTTMRSGAFKTLTGKDTSVIDYLNRQESVHQFFANVLSLVDTSVQTYQRRGFSSLMVSFGCTGGQHRSVFLAEQLAKHLRGSGGVEVVLRHIELEKMGK